VWSVNQPYKKVKNYARGRSSTFNGEELFYTTKYILLHNLKITYFSCSVNKLFVAIVLKIFVTL
ncbi:hypothetical protein P4U99_27220, partial [Brevibacillus agri]|uniref:hypothetical protein n=1 Tax=Brevibacillus agri TaxID=51101 RepID=UPI002E1C0127|nr:hypothetical protein [Brevibacillus agri]